MIVGEDVGLHVILHPLGDGWDGVRGRQTSYPDGPPSLWVRGEVLGPDTRGIHVGPGALGPGTLSHDVETAE